jgi:hypothetical protein
MRGKIANLYGILTGTYNWKRSCGRLGPSWENNFKRTCRRNYFQMTYIDYDVSEFIPA